MMPCVDVPYATPCYADVDAMICCRHLRLLMFTIITPPTALMPPLRHYATLDAIDYF